MRRNPAPRIAEGLAIARAMRLKTSSQTAAAAGATTAVVLMPARFQVDDADYGRLKDGRGGGRRERWCETRRPSGSTRRWRRWECRKARRAAGAARGAARA